MAADITMVAAGIVAAAQPSMASEAMTPPPLPEPTALEQAEPTAPVIAEQLSSQDSQLAFPPITATTAPDFSPATSAPEANPSVESLAEVAAIEAQLINEQLGQAPISLPIASPVEIQSAAMAKPAAYEVAQPPSISQPAPAPTAIPVSQSSAYEQRAGEEAEVALESPGSEGVALSENDAFAKRTFNALPPAIAPTTATRINQREAQRLQQQAQSITHNIPVPEAVALENNTHNISATPSPNATSSQLTFESYQQERAQALDRFEAQLIHNQASRTLAAKTASPSPSTQSSTTSPQGTPSLERQILAQVMMDSAESQFLETSGLGNISSPEASPNLDTQGSGPVVQNGMAQNDMAQDHIGQVTSVSQLRDVQPTDWAYQATQSLVERYGCTAGYPDGSFRGNRALSRYEFAAGLNACLDRVTELLPIAGVEGGFAAREDLAVAQQLAEQFQTELEQVRNSVTSLEQRQADLETQQFSPTTKLYGQSIFALRGSNNNDVDLFPVDGDPERSGAGDVTLGGSAELTLATSFRGNDLLLTSLQAGNIAATASTQFTNMGRLAYENDTDNQLVLSDLSYRFAATPNLGVIVGSHGVNPTNTFRGISPLEGSGDGAISRLGQRNPILELGSGRGGAGFDWQVARNVSIQGVYSATSPNQAGNNVGLFNGGYVAGGQVSAGIGRSADLGIHYLHSYSPNGSLGTGIGDAQVISPFASEGSSFRTHAVGATAAWRPTQRLVVGGWGGWTSSTPTSLTGTVQTTNWMGFAQVNDLFQRGNALGLLLGQPPKITSSNLPVGFNFPEFSDGGGRGGRRDTALHLEAFYRAQLNDQISVTPGIVVVRNPNHNADNDTLVVGAMRTTFRF